MAGRAKDIVAAESLHQAMMNPLSKVMDADPRTVAQDAIRLADTMRDTWRWSLLPESITRGLTLTPTLARMLLTASDELAEARDLLTDEGFSLEKKLADSISFALLIVRAERDGITADRDELLADLPHALGKCECVPEERTMRHTTLGVTTGFRMPEAHDAAIVRLEARMTCSQ